MAQLSHLPVPLSAVEVIRLPWSFTQQHPLDTADVIKEAKRRGFRLELGTLRELYRLQLLVPMVGLTGRPVSAVWTPIAGEPRGSSSRHTELRIARNTGRVRDLAASPYLPRLAFKRAPRRPRWWNGLLYSPYQLLVLRELSNLLDRRSLRVRKGRIVGERLPRPSEHQTEVAVRYHRLALVLTALEARYRPALDSEWLHLVSVGYEEWDQYRRAFDPVGTLAALQLTAEILREDAEFLLFRAHDVDPLQYEWSYLARRASRSARQRLTGPALLAMDLREAAEILLHFYEDLVAVGAAPALPKMSRVSWHPLRERLSNHSGTLDQNLMSLGLSPHPRVVLGIEGESEEVHVPRVWQTLGFPLAPELVRILTLRGVDHDPTKVAALAAAPLVGERAPQTNYWELIKPPTQLLIATDPEGKYFGSTAKIAKTKANILKEIRAVLLAQGVDAADEQELEQLIEIRTWAASCYEFAHFTDDELAAALIAMSSEAASFGLAALATAVATERARGKDLKEVWSLWKRRPSKRDLAGNLWPVLEAKINLWRTDPAAPTPPVVDVIVDAYQTAQRWRYGSFVLVEADESDARGS